MEDYKTIIKQMEEKLDEMLLARPSSIELNEEELPEELRGVAQRINKLARNIDELQRFGSELALGDLGTQIPSRDNYLAGPFKEIHSQFMTASYSMEQLVKGKMVSRLNLPGNFFTAYNKLVDRVSQALSTVKDNEPEWGDDATSWRYHQILVAINKLNIMLLEVDAAGRIMFANPHAREVFADMDRLPYEDCSKSNALTQYLCTFADRVARLEPSKLMFEEFPELYELHDTDSGQWYKITSDVLNLTDGSIGVLHMIDNISDWKNQEKQLTYRATIDQLTSAYTRSAGIRKLEEIIRVSEEEENCVAFIDIDELKSINDRYGHTEGDFVIKTIAKILIDTIRDTDWVVRYGGDEFLVLLRGSNIHTAQKAVDRMRNRLQETNEKLDKPYQLSFSIGLSEITPDMQSVQDVIEIVDQAMYDDKVRKKKDIVKKKK